MQLLWPDLAHADTRGPLWRVRELQAFHSPTN